MTRELIVLSNIFQGQKMLTTDKDGNLLSGYTRTFLNKSNDQAHSEEDSHHPRLSTDTLDSFFKYCYHDHRDIPHQKESWKSRDDIKAQSGRNILLGDEEERRVGGTDKKPGLISDCNGNIGYSYGGDVILPWNYCKSVIAPL